MTMPQAIKALGPSRPAWELRNMRLALSLCPRLNTEAESERLAACVYVLRRMTAYHAACQAIRDNRHA